MNRQPSGTWHPALVTPNSDARPTYQAMDDQEVLNDRRRALAESVDYFSQGNKSEREKWVCSRFLEILEIAFTPDEVSTAISEPPDVLFRDAQFEIKEILDPGRRRHAELKEALQKAWEATSPRQLYEQYTPKDIAPLQVADRVLAQLNDLATHYAPAVRTKLDLLFYVNLEGYILKAGPMPGTGVFSGFGWRSISAIKGWGGLVLTASSNAPEFIRRKAGILTHRTF